MQGYLWDTFVTGFAARKQTNGTFYYIRYRHNGAQTVRSIGRHGPLTPDTARAKAKQLLGVVAGGIDPFAQALSGEGFPAAVERYLERKRSSLKPTYFVEASRYLRSHAAPLHSLRLSQIDRRKIAALLGEIETSSGPAARNRLRSTLSAFFNWCITEGLLETNPVQGTAKANEGGSRERVLTVLRQPRRRKTRKQTNGTFYYIRYRHNGMQTVKSIGRHGADLRRPTWLSLKCNRTSSKRCSTTSAATRLVSLAFITAPNIPMKCERHSSVGATTSTGLCDEA